MKLAAEWERELEVLQAEKLRDQQRRDILSLREVESDSIVQALDAEMQQLIKVGLSTCTLNVCVWWLGTCILFLMVDRTQHVW